MGRNAVFFDSQKRRYCWLLALLVIAASAAFAKDASYRPRRLADGSPDLEGMWDHIDATPLERPPGFDSLIITPAQAAQIERSIDTAAEDRSTPTEPTEFFNARRIHPIRGELHSSIIVDPLDGKLPWTPSRKEWQPKARAAIINAMDGPEQRPTSERCLGNPASQPPYLYNPGTNLHQIVQTTEVVVFLSEFGNNARIIRLRAPHAPAAVASWLGDSIGWWEGDTLVIETKNFTSSDTGRIATPNVFMISSRATVVERITRVSENELNYAFTVDDPDYYTRPWKGETHFMRTTDRPLEYACHEGNDTMIYNLRAARIRDGQWPTAAK